MSKKARRRRREERRRAEAAAAKPEATPAETSQPEALEPEASGVAPRASGAGPRGPGAELDPEGPDAAGPTTARGPSELASDPEPSPVASAGNEAPVAERGGDAPAAPIDRGASDEGTSAPAVAATSGEREVEGAAPGASIDPRPSEEMGAPAVAALHGTSPAERDVESIAPAAAIEPSREETEPAAAASLEAAPRAAAIASPVPQERAPPAVVGAPRAPRPAGDEITAAPPASAPSAPPLAGAPRKQAAAAAVARPPRPGALRPVAAPSRVVRPESAPPRARPLGTPKPARPTASRRPVPPLPPDPGPRPADVRPARPVVKVSMAQAAAAGRQALRTSSSVPESLRRGGNAAGPLVPTAHAPPVRGPAAPEVVAPPEPLALPRPVAAMLGVASMSSPACVAHVERAVRAVPGVVEAEASLAAGLVAVSGEVDPAALEKALADAGHPAAQAHDSAEARADARALLLSAAGAAGAGIASWALGTSAAPPPLALAAAALGVAAGHRLAPTVLRHLARARPCAELLPAISALLLLGLGAARTASPALAVLPVAGHLLAAALASRLRAQVLAVMERLRAAVPKDAPEGGAIDVEAGDRLPADGRLLSPAVLDESELGGEDELERGPGELVLAGTRARTPARIDVIAGGTRVADGVELTRRALATHPQGKAAQAAARAVIPAALGVAALAGALQGWLAAAAVLAAAAPLAIGVSASLSGASGLVRALARGIAFRSFEALRRAGSVRTLVLDRGSLVLRGDASVTDVIVRPGADEREALRLAGAAEAGLDHPLARGIAAYLRDLALDVPASRDRRVHPGRGVEATVENRRVIVGSAQLASRLGLDVSQLEQSAEESARRGRTPLFVAIDGDVQLVIALGRTPHESTRRAFGSIENLGVNVELASADAAGSARWVAEVCGLPGELALGHAAPEAVRAHVAGLRRLGPVAVAIGDENELPVLAAADLPVTVAGTRALRPAAAGLILRPDPAAAVELVRAGRATRWALRVSGAVGIAGTVAGVALAAAGVLGPAGAAVLALGTSVTAMGIAAAPLAR